MVRWFYRCLGKSWIKRTNRNHDEKCKRLVDSRKICFVYVIVECFNKGDTSIKT